jgi:hypothetical protein
MANKAPFRAWMRAIESPFMVLPITVWTICAWSGVLVLQALSLYSQHANRCCCRSEARGIPHIVTAPSSKKPDNYNHEDDEDDYEEHVDDYGGYYEDMSENGNQDGWYEDGAYVAPSIAATPTIGPERPGKDPQDAFYDALKTRFESLRYRLRAPPSVQAVHQLDHRHPISLPFGNRLADKEWKNHLIHTTPLPAQLASLDTPSILRLLKLVEGQLENCRKTNIPHNLSLWAWSLLARLEDVGLLQTRDVSVVRDLAKMAAWVRMMHLRTKYGRAGDPEFEHLDRYPEESAGLHDDGDYEEEEGEEEFVADDATKEGATHEDTALQDTEAGEEVTDKQEKVAMDLNTEDDLSDIMAAKKRQLQAEANVQAATQSKEQEQEKHHDEVPDINTNVTIDMLITVAADFYGQKDLLVGRLPW